MSLFESSSRFNLSYLILSIFSKYCSSFILASLYILFSYCLCMFCLVFILFSNLSKLVSIASISSISLYFLIFSILSFFFLNSSSRFFKSSLRSLSRDSINYYFFLVTLSCFSSSF